MTYLGAKMSTICQEVFEAMRVNLTLMHVSSSTKMPYRGRTNGKFMTLEVVHLETFTGICVFN